MPSPGTEEPTDASSPQPRQTSNLLQAVKKHKAICEDENAFATLGSFEDMQPIKADV